MNNLREKLFTLHTPETDYFELSVSQYEQFKSEIPVLFQTQRADLYQNKITHVGFAPGVFAVLTPDITEIKQVYKGKSHE